jgi:hypothetical protein
MNGRFIFSATNDGFFGVLRFNNDGSVDRSYSSTNVIAGYLNSFVLQPDEKLIVGGRAASIAGIARNGIVRLNSDGSLDTVFNPRIGDEGDVFSVAAQPSGTILIGGSFRTVNDLPRSRIAQLNADGTTVGSVEFNPPGPVLDRQFRLTTKSYTTTEQIIEASTNLLNWVPIYTNTTPGSLLDFIDAADGQYRQRFYRAVMKP